MIQISVRWPGIAVDSAVFAPTVGVNGLVEGDVRRIVMGNNRLGRFIGNDGGGSGRAVFVVTAAPFIVEAYPLQLVEPRCSVRDTAPAFDGCRMHGTNSLYTV